MTVHRAYYNEIDRFCCDWLSNLMDAGLITPGKIDDRSIVDVRPDDLAGFERAHFFAGIGGWDYALRLAGMARCSPVWTGSCPCQPFSLAGKQKGFADERHLWPVWRELIRKCGPAIVFGEQVASASEWLGLVRGDLEAMAYAVGAMPIQAASAGADHLRDRYWFVAHADDARSQGRRLLPECAGERIAGPDGMANAQSERGRARLRESVQEQNGDGSTSRGRDAGDVADSAGPSRPEYVYNARERPGASQNDHAEHQRDSGLEWVAGADGKARRVKSGVRLLAHGIPNRVGLLRGFGNAIDPRCAAEFIAAASEALT